MRSRTAATIAAAAATATAAVLLAGCGSTTGSTTGAGTASPDPSASTSTQQCGDLVVTPTSATREVCLGVGSTLRIQLAQGDQPPTEKGAALTQVSSGVYRGAQAGSAELTGFRHVCPSASPGGVSCLAIAGWKVTVDVR